MDHDDGQAPEDYDQADVVIIGISRTSKDTDQHLSREQGDQNSQYSYRAGRPMPESLLTATRPLIVGLIATSDRISQVRENRILGVTPGYGPQRIRRSRLHYRRTQICEVFVRPEQLARHRCHEAIVEETAAAIVALRPKPR